MNQFQTSLEKPAGTLATEIARIMGGIIIKPEAILIDSAIDSAFGEVEEAFQNIDGKSVIKTAAIGVGILALGYLAYTAVSKFKAAINDWLEPKMEINIDAFDETIPAQKIRVEFADGTTVELSNMDGNHLSTNGREVKRIILL